MITALCPDSRVFGPKESLNETCQDFILGCCSASNVALPASCCCCWVSQTTRLLTHMTGQDAARSTPQHRLLLNHWRPGQPCMTP